MKKKNVNIVLVLICISIMSFFQFNKTEKILLSNNFTNEGIKSYEEIVVISNRPFIINKKKYAEKLLDKYLNNEFETTYFSFDFGLPSQIHMYIYRNDFFHRVNNLYFVVDCNKRNSEKVNIRYDIEIY